MSVNLDAARGLEPLDNGVAGTAPRVEHFTAGTAIYSGQLLRKNAAASTVSPLATTAAATLTAIIGVAAHKAANGARVAVYTDPDCRFVIQKDDNTVTTLLGLLHRNFNVINVTAKYTTLGNSLMELDGNTATSVDNSTTARTLRVVDIVRDGVNATNGSWTKLVVAILPKHHIMRSIKGI